MSSNPADWKPFPELPRRNTSYDRELALWTRTTDPDFEFWFGNKLSSRPGMPFQVLWTFSYVLDVVRLSVCQAQAKVYFNYGEDNRPCAGYVSGNVSEGHGALNVGGGIHLIHAITENVGYLSTSGAPYDFELWRREKTQPCAQCTVPAGKARYIAIDRDCAG